MNNFWQRHHFAAMWVDEHCQTAPVKSAKETHMSIDLIESPPPSQVARRALTEQDAVDIWLARWLRTPRKAILARYGCDPRRLYEVWEGSHFPGSRTKALDRLRERYPGLVERIDPGTHRRIPKTPHPDQLTLFD
jgi:hypothetical protein